MFPPPCCAILSGSIARSDLETTFAYQVIHVKLSLPWIMNRDEIDTSTLVYGVERARKISSMTTNTEFCRTLTDMVIENHCPCLKI